MQENAWPVVTLSGTRLWLLATCLLAIYILMPSAIFEGAGLDFYPYTLFEADIAFTQISVLAFTSLALASMAVLFKRTILLQLPIQPLLRLARLALGISIASGMPLILALASQGVPADRTASFEMFEVYRSNIAWVIASNTYLTAAICLALAGRWRHFALFCLIALLPELMLGSRITAFRTVVAMAGLVQLRPAQAAAAGVLGFVTFFSRSLFLGQDLGTEAVGLVLSFGEVLNTALGANLVWQSPASVDCSALGGAARGFIPPPLRALSPAFDDYTNCINERYFDTFDLKGLAGSPVTDLVLAWPVFYVLLLMLTLPWLLRKPRKPLHGLRSVALIFLLTGLPYVARWGFIASVAFLVSFLVWYLLPLSVLCGLHRSRESTSRSAG